MNTENILLSVFLFFFSFLSLHSQSKIKGDLLTLSELTLDRSPLIKRNALDIDLANAQYGVVRSAFDYRIFSNLRFSKNRFSFFDADPRNQILLSDLKTRNTDFLVGLQKRFRTGLTASLSSNYTQISDNFPLDVFNEEIGGNVAYHENSLTLSLMQPVLRGNGFKVNTAFEKLAIVVKENTSLIFELNTASEISQLGNAYWQFLAAFETLKIYKDNENRVLNVLKVTQELVKADKRAESDLFQIKADLAQQEQQTIRAEQNFYNARANLGRVIGISEETSQNIGNPINPFPTILGSDFNSRVSVKKMFELAKANRTDILAYQGLNGGLELLLKQAENGVLPQLDLNGFITYTGSANGGGVERYFNSLGNRQGRNLQAGLGLTFSFPVNNNLAKANLLTAQVNLDGQLIEYRDLLRNIELNVGVAINNLENSVLILKKTQQNLEYSLEVFDNEQIKFQNGMTTLLNLILFQERLTFAQLEYIQAQQQYAQNIINLRFQTGTLISVGSNNRTVPLERRIFYELPKI